MIRNCRNALMLVSLFCIALLAAPFALAETAAKAPKATKTVETMVVEPEAGPRGKAQLQLGLGLESALGTSGGTFDLGVFLKPSPSCEFHIGLETGLHIWPNTALINGNVSGANLSLPILLSSYYVLGAEGAIRPYAGFAAGVWIALSNSRTGLAMFFRPGVIIPAGGNLDILLEGRFGAVDGLLVMNPRAALAIKF